MVKILEIPATYYDLIHLWGTGWDIVILTGRERDRKEAAVPDKTPQGLGDPNPVQWI